MFGRKSTTTSAAVMNAADDDGKVDVLLVDGGGAADGPDQLWQPATSGRTRKSVEQLLLERGQITDEQLTQARGVQAQTPGKAISQILLTMNAANEGQILSAIAETLGIAFEVPE